MKRDDPLPTMECLKFKRPMFGRECSVEIVKASKCPKVVVIPDEYEGYPVTSISDSGFSDCHALEAIWMPATIREIKSYAFQSCSSLKHITIPDSVTYLGSHVFDSCRKLRSIDLSKRLQKIPDYAFTECSSLVDIVLPSSIKEIGTYAFSKCSSLETLELPNNNFFWTIESGVFNECINLFSLTIPKSVKTIKSYAFSRCREMLTIDIPASINQIHYDAFDGCKELKRIHFFGSEALAASKNYSRDYCTSNIASKLPQTYFVIDDDNKSDITWLYGMPVLRIGQEYNFFEQAGIIVNGNVDLKNVIVTREKMPGYPGTAASSNQVKEEEEVIKEEPEIDAQKVIMQKPESAFNANRLIVEVLSLSNNPNKPDIVQIAAQVMEGLEVKESITLCIDPSQYEGYENSNISKLVMDGLIENGMKQDEVYAQFKKFIEDNYKSETFGDKLVFFSYHAKETWDKLNAWFTYHHDPFLKSYFKPIQIDVSSLVLGLYPTFFQFGSMEFQPIWDFCVKNNIIGPDRNQFDDTYQELANIKLGKVCVLLDVLIYPVLINLENEKN